MQLIWKKLMKAYCCMSLHKCTIYQYLECSRGFKFCWVWHWGWTLQRVRLANRGRLLLRTPGPVPFGTCICSNVETILSWTRRLFEFRTSLGTSFLLCNFFLEIAQDIHCTRQKNWRNEKSPLRALEIMKIGLSEKWHLLIMIFSKFPDAKMSR